MPVDPTSPGRDAAKQRVSQLPQDGAEVAVHPGRDEEIDSRKGLVNQALDRQNTVARPPLGN